MNVGTNQCTSYSVLCPAALGEQAQIQGCRSRGPGGTPSVFGRLLIQPYLNHEGEGADYAHHINNCHPPGFSDLPTFLHNSTDSIDFHLSTLCLFHRKTGKTCEINVDLIDEKNDFSCVNNYQEEFSYSNDHKILHVYLTWKMYVLISLEKENNYIFMINKINRTLVNSHHTCSRLEGF